MTRTAARPVPLADRARLRALERSGLLRSGAGEAFDRLTRLAVRTLDVPIALVSIVEPERQFFKSCIGLPEPWASARETPLSHSFCQHAVLSTRPLVIEDARRHPLVRDSAAIEDLGVVAYAGIPLFTSDGFVVGTFCAIDTQPRAWSDDDLQVLHDLAEATMREIQYGDRALEHARGESTDDGDAPGLNIAAVAQRTGVAADTLRKWEQRYRILRPKRTEGGQRRYDESDVDRVLWLKARLAEGYRIGEAAALLGRNGSASATKPPEFRKHLEAAAMRADALELGRLLDHVFAVFPVERALGEVVQPLLERVGEAWEAGEFTVAQEHLVTASVRARIDRLLADARGGVHGVAVLACAPGERHELGLLMLAVMLRADGWQVAYLGADMPLEDALDLARTTGARLLCLSAALEERLPELEQALATAEPPPGLELVVGGAAATPEFAERVGARYANTNLRATVRALRKLA